MICLRRNIPVTGGKELILIVAQNGPFVQKNVIDYVKKNR
jgi:hypothetical protein